MIAGARPVVLCTAAGIPALGPSGASAHLRGVARALRAPIVAACRSDSRGEQDEPGTSVLAPDALPGWPTWALRYRELNEIRVARLVVGLCREQRPTLIWERHALYSVTGSLLSADIPRILEVNAPLVRERRMFESLTFPWLGGATEAIALESASRVVTVSTWLADWARSEGARDVRHVPNGVEPHVGDREGTRRRLGLDGQLVLGFLGSMKPWHGVERLPELLDAIPDAVGLCVGDGPVKITHPRLRCVGQVPEREVADYVAAMDIGLAPYRADAPPWFCPLKILAYRAQGTPVVASDIGDCTLMTGDGGTCGPELIGAIEHWRGRRATVNVRSWSDVVHEALA